MKMKTLHMLWTWIFLSGFRSLATDGADIHGYSGKDATITCSHGWASTNIKYFCRDPCEDRDVLVKSDQTPTGRYTLKDHGDGSFTVNITDLQESDSGIYWCGVERFVQDTFKEVQLNVSKDLSKSFTTSTQVTQPYKNMQTFTELHTTTPAAAAHSGSPSTTARLSSRDASPDDITLSPSATVSVNTTVYIPYAVGSLLVAAIIFGVGWFAVHQHRKKIKTSAGITLPDESKAEQDDHVYENDTNRLQMKPINRTTTQQEQIYLNYSNMPSMEHELYGNL